MYLNLLCYLLTACGESTKRVVYTRPLDTILWKRFHMTFSNTKLLFWAASAWRFQYIIAIIMEIMVIMKFKSLLKRSMAFGVVSPKTNFLSHEVKSGWWANEGRGLFPFLFLFLIFHDNCRDLIWHCCFNICLFVLKMLIEVSFN